MNIENKMPKPRSPEFKVPSPRLAPKASVEKNTKQKNQKDPACGPGPKALHSSGSKPGEYSIKKNSSRYSQDSKRDRSRSQKSQFEDDDFEDDDNVQQPIAVKQPTRRDPSGGPRSGQASPALPVAKPLREKGPTSFENNSGAQYPLNDFETKNNRKSPYPEAIAGLIELSLMEADQVREAFKWRNRQHYVRIFQAYKDKLADRDYSIIRGATGYLYENSRIKSINEETALWMLGIHEIPASQIQSYTSKAVLEKIARDCGLMNSGKKAEVLIQNIRSVIDSSK